MSKVIKDSKTGLPKIIIEEKDLMDIVHIQEMMSGNFTCHKCGTEQKNNGWTNLTGYLESEKIKLESKIFESLDTREEEALTRIKMAVVKGFKHFLDLPYKITAQADRIREKLKDQEDNSNDGTAKRNEYGD